MRYLLDTHLAYWWQTSDKRLGDARRIIEREAEEAFVSQVSMLELTIKERIDRVVFQPATFVRNADGLGFQWLPLRNEHVMELSRLNKIVGHKDPFDRLIVAQAKSESLFLLTVDERLGAYGPHVRVI